MHSISSPTSTFKASPFAKKLLLHDEHYHKWSWLFCQYPQNDKYSVQSTINNNVAEIHTEFYSTFSFRTITEMIIGYLFLKKG